MRDALAALNRGTGAVELGGRFGSDLFLLNDFPSLEALRDRILGFQRYYEEIAQPFQWKFTRRDLESLLNRLNTRATTYAYVAA